MLQSAVLQHLVVAVIQEVNYIKFKAVLIYSARFGLYIGSEKMREISAQLIEDAVERIFIEANGKLSASLEEKIRNC